MIISFYGSSWHSGEALLDLDMDMDMDLDLDLDHGIAARRFWRLRAASLVGPRALVGLIECISVSHL